MTIAQGLLYALSGLVVLAALQDVAQLRISNLFPVSVVALFAAWVAVRGLEADLWQNGLAFLVTLLVGMLLFSRGWLGGGDVKLLAAIALWFDISGGLALVVYVAMGGGLLALLFLIARRLIPAPRNGRTRPPALTPRGPIPYGIAIAAGTILCLAWHGPNPLA
jgi:prepilin peptidase CpaA